MRDDIPASQADRIRPILEKLLADFDELQSQLQDSVEPALTFHPEPPE